MKSFLYLKLLQFPYIFMFLFKKISLQDPDPGGKFDPDPGGKFNADPQHW